MKTSKMSGKAKRIAAILSLISVHLFATAFANAGLFANGMARFHYPNREETFAVTVMRFALMVLEFLL